MREGTMASAVSTTLNELPDDLMERILYHLPLQSMPAVACCSTLIRRLTCRRLLQVLELAAFPFSMPKRAIVGERVTNLKSRKLFPENVATLASACAAGALGSCTEFHLSGNDLQSSGLVALSLALRQGALTHLTYLSLYKNGIGDEGVVALAQSLAYGALPKLDTLLLNNNQLGNESMVALASAAQSGGLACLSKFCLSSNRIGDQGAMALALAGAEGFFGMVRFLVLERNHIGDMGMLSIATAISAHGAFRSCFPRSADERSCNIFLMSNPGTSAPVDEAIRRRSAPQVDVDDAVSLWMDSAIIAH
jgi:hypothetical protein